MLFQQESVGLIADLPGASAKSSAEGTTPAPQPGVTTELPTEHFKNQEQHEIESKFKDNAMNVWYAAAAHAVTFVLAVIRFMMVKNRL